MKRELRHSVAVLPVTHDGPLAIRVDEKVVAEA